MSISCPSTACILFSVVLAKPYTKVFSFLSMDCVHRLSCSLFWWAPQVKPKLQMELTPARNARHWLSLRHSDYPYNILIKFSFPIRNISDELPWPLLKWRLTMISQHIAWSRKLVRVWPLRERRALSLSLRCVGHFEPNILVFCWW